MIYLDYAAATPMDPRVLAAMQPYFADNFYNPSAIYLAAKGVKTDVETARATVAKVIGARSGEIIFTAGGTEANNLAIHGVMRQFPHAQMVVSAVEHESVLKPAQGYAAAEALVDSKGSVDVPNLVQLINDQTVLVSVMYANNEIGTVQPLREIATKLQFIREDRQKRGIALPLYFHTDACQAGNYLDLHASRLGVDLMTLNGGKIYGPKQSGVLYAASHVRLSPLVHGGGQERGLRSGTENVAGIIGFAAALEQAQASRREEVERLKMLQATFMSELETAISGVVINGSQKHRLPNNVHLTIPGQDNERLIFALDEAGIQAAAGSACSASSEEPSHVLKALGMGDGEARASLRFSMGRNTTQAEITKTVQMLAKLVAG